jgi:hypothetical protein
MLPLLVLLFGWAWACSSSRIVASDDEEQKDQGRKEVDIGVEWGCDGVGAGVGSVGGAGKALDV